LSIVIKSCNVTEKVTGYKFQIRVSGACNLKPETGALPLPPFMTALSKNTSFQVELSTRQIIKLAAPISFAILIPQINFVTNNKN
jgi:hypothetical protein